MVTNIENLSSSNHHVTQAQPREAEAATRVADSLGTAPKHGISVEKYFYETAIHRIGTCGCVNGRLHLCYPMMYLKENTNYLPSLPHDIHLLHT